MRLADYINANFPNYLKSDQLALYPNGFTIGYKPLLAFLIVIISKITTINLELVGAFLPPIIGALTVIPAYFLGKHVFGKGVAILGSLLFILLPGEFLHRSLLGYPDHHFLEVLLSILTLLFLVLFEKFGGYKWPILAGVSLGLYLMNWYGAYLLVAIIMVWAVIKFGYLIYIKERTGVFLKGMLIMLGTSFAMSYIFLDSFTKIAILFTIAFVALLFGLTKSPGGLISLVVVLLAPLTVAFIIKFGDLMLSRLISAFWGFGSTISEAAPTTLNLALRSYGLGAFMTLGGLYLAIKNRTNLLLLTFSIIILLLTIGQLRWGYYMVLGVALFSAYLILSVPKYLKKVVRPTVVSLLILFPLMSFYKATYLTVHLQNDISVNWYQSLIWLKENSPEPYDDPNYYTTNNLSLPKYGVLTWWDFGDWVIKISKRSPTANNMAADNPPFPQFITSKTKEEAEKHLEGLNIKYILLDWDVLTTKWYAVKSKTGTNLNPPETIAMKLWNGELQGYKLVYVNGPVRILEKQN